MSFPAVYLSRPAARLPKTRLSNDDLLARIRANFKGTPEEFAPIEAAVRHVFDKCNSGYRYIEEDHKARMGDYAFSVAQAVLLENGVDPKEVGLLIYGGISREYFEPATAMEVAGKLGIEEVRAFDVTSACAGQMEGIQIAAATLAVEPKLKYALVCSAELTRHFLSYDIQSPEEMITKAAGLTIGHAATAVLIGRTPFKGGSARLIGMRTHSMPQHWGLCSAPIDGTFTSRSSELFRLNVHVPAELTAMCREVGWTPADVTHFVCHQPSESIVRKVLENLGVPVERALLTHHDYANTASTTVTLSLHELLKTGRVKAGDKLLLHVAAAGFSMVSAAAEWVE